MGHLIGEIAGGTVAFLLIVGLPLIFISYIFSLTPIGKIFVEYLRKKLNSELISKKDYQVLENKNKQLQERLLEYESELSQLREALVFNETHKISNINKNNINLEKN